MPLTIEHRETKQEYNRLLSRMFMRTIPFFNDMRINSQWRRVFTTPSNLELWPRLAWNELKGDTSAIEIFCREGMDSIFMYVSAILGEEGLYGFPSLCTYQLYLVKKVCMDCLDDSAYRVAKSHGDGERLSASWCQSDGRSPEILRRLEEVFSHCKRCVSLLLRLNVQWRGRITQGFRFGWCFNCLGAFPSWLGFWSTPIVHRSPNFLYRGYCCNVSQSWSIPMILTLLSLVAV